MAEGKKQRKFGRNGRSNSSKLQVARTAANKARNARRSSTLAKAGKSLWVPRGAARALRRAVQLFGKRQAAVLENIPIRYVVSTIGEAQATRVLGIVW